MITIYPETRIATNDVMDTLRHMRRIIDETCTSQAIRNLAVRILRSVEPKDRAGEAQAIQDFIVDRIDYRWDPVGTEWIQYPHVTLREKSGDCDDMAILAGSLLQSVGHSVIPCAVTWIGHDEPSHAVIFDEMSGLFVDPVAGIQVDQWPPHPYKVKNLRGIR